MNKTEVKIKKPICLGLLILDISKTLIYKLWYDYVKPKYGNKAKICYMDTDSFLFVLKLKIFTQTLLAMLKNGLIHQTMM